MRLTPAEAEAYARDGYFLRREALPRPVVDELRDGADDTQLRVAEVVSSGHTYFLDGKRFVDVGPSTVQFEHRRGSVAPRVVEPAHLFAPAFDKIIDHPALTQPMMGLLGCSELALWTIKLNCKPPDGSGFGWHQDAPYWIHDSPHVDQLPNVMIALDDASEDNGCFCVIRGSHREGCLPGTDDGTQLGGFFTDPDAFSLTDRVAFDVPAGSLIFFHPATVHGSAPNRTARARRALIVTYQPGGHAALKTKTERKVRISA